VDLSQSPSTVAMTCDGTVGVVSLAQPCLVGMDLRARGERVPGTHAIECRLAQANEPLVWSFIMPLAQVASDPEAVLHMPGEAPTVPAGSGSVALGSQQATLSTVMGELTFSRIDPTGRAFAATIDAKVVWKAAAGSDITCDLKGPLWGAPGDFL
jgi:hypothetical protein